MMCGGDQRVVEDLNPLLSTMASNILYMGPVGSGQLTKLINQLLFDINAAALAEMTGFEPVTTAFGGRFRRLDG